MKRVTNPSRLIGPSLIVALSAMLSLGAMPASAYETDTHFSMTYALCRLTGFTDSEATMVAAMDQGMDDSQSTNAIPSWGDAIPTLFHSDEQNYWHAIPFDGTAPTVLGRKDILWRQALNEDDSASSLLRLGIFFHYQQDTWAHRHHPNSDPMDFEPYSPPLGHSIDGHQPDRPPYDPVAALRCAEEFVGYARLFLSDKLGRTPDSRFDDYQPVQNPQIEQGWPGDPALFHQLSSDASTPARKLLTGLIRAQIGAYTASTDKFFHLGRTDADEADWGLVSLKINDALSASDITDILVPVTRVPITDLTTDMLRQLDGTPLAQRY